MSPPGQRLHLPPHIDRETFLRDFWQKRPLLMRAAIAADCFTLDADELAGLACEPEFESRLIIQHDDESWEVCHGPLVEDNFATLPNSHWTLLVQDVDKYVPEVARLIDDFSFVPGWRIDDIMISYASDHGGVGPHTDAYDVFLMQAEGRRRWRISEKRYSDDDLIPDLEQRILSNFETDEEWVLEPGDVLYLPPGVAHWGIAEGACITYSLGFRAPSQLELVSDWFQHLVSLSDQRRLADPDDLRTDSLAELTPGVHAGAAKLLDALPSAHSREFQLWLGSYLTEPKAQFHTLAPDQPWDLQDLDDWLAQGKGLSRHPFARLAWSSLAADEVVLFYQGEHLSQPAGMLELVKLIAERRQISAQELPNLPGTEENAKPLLLHLLNLGILEFLEPARWR